LCEERGITFPALTVVDEMFDIKDDVREDLRKNHTRGINALPVIFPISATQVLNAQIATYFRSSLQKKLWKFLIPEADAEEYLTKTNKEFTANSMDSETTAYFLHPHVQTGLFINECINLDMSLSNGMVKLTEKAGAYKDRYSCISYCSYTVSAYFDKNLLTEVGEDDGFGEIASLVQSV
jgi:hypothetical protein